MVLAMYFTNFISKQVVLYANFISKQVVLDMGEKIGFLDDNWGFLSWRNYL